MILACPRCSTRYEIDPAILSNGGRTVRCTKCSKIWRQVLPDETPDKDVPVIETPSDELSADQEQPPKEETPLDDDPSSVPDEIDPDEIDFDEVEPDDVEPEETEAPVLPPDPLAASIADFRRSRTPEEPKRSRLAMALWVFLAMLAIGGPVTGYFLRTELVRIWPAAATLYGLVGLQAEPVVAGLALRDVEWKKTTKKGAKLLRVEGKVANISDRVREVPPILGVLFDKDERELQRWTFEAPESWLLPGEKVPFTTLLKDPAGNASRLTIVFVPRK